MKILFTGDSITDAGRSVSNGSTVSIGQGYALLVAAKLGAESPGEHEFVNTGISGNRIVDVYARIKRDVWNPNPDMISILIGVNDVWHELEVRNGVDASRFEVIYRHMMAETLSRFPNARILLMAPFVLKGSATEGAFDYFVREVSLRAAVTKKIAEEFGLGFLDLQAVFDAAAAKTKPEDWTADGVHPTPAGHQLIADEWLRWFDSIQ